MQGEGTPSSLTGEAEAAPASTRAILRFRHSARGSGVSRTGTIRPGGLLWVEYDPARLPPVSETRDTRAGAEEIICHMQFHPGGQRHSGPVFERSRGVARPGSARQVPFEARVPAEATRVELWFESRDPHGTRGWDSRYGQNYSFAVLRDGLPVPEPAVALRSAAIVDASIISVVEDAARKEQTKIGAGGKRLHAGLVVRALVAESVKATDVWADIHVFDAADELVHASTVPLRQPPDSGSGAPFVWADDIYQGSGGGSGMGVWSRPDAHVIQYRLYCQDGSSAPAGPARLFTDGILHEFELPSDEDVGSAVH